MVTMGWLVYKLSKSQWFWIYKLEDFLEVFTDKDNWHSFRNYAELGSAARHGIWRYTEKSVNFWKFFEKSYLFVSFDHILPLRSERFDHLENINSSLGFKRTQRITKC